MNKEKHDWRNYRVPSQVRTYEPMDVPFGPVNLIARERLPGAIVQHMNKGVYVIRVRDKRLALCDLSSGETVVNLSEVGSRCLYALGVQTLGKAEN